MPLFRKLRDCRRCVGIRTSGCGMIYRRRLETKSGKAKKRLSAREDDCRGRVRGGGGPSFGGRWSDECVRTYRWISRLPLVSHALRLLSLSCRIVLLFDRAMVVTTEEKLCRYRTPLCPCRGSHASRPRYLLSFSSRLLAERAAWATRHLCPLHFQAMMRPFSDCSRISSRLCKWKWIVYVRSTRNSEMRCRFSLLPSFCLRRS